MAKASQEMLDRVIMAAPGGKNILHVVRIGEGTPPAREEDLPRYEAAKEVTDVYRTLVAKASVGKFFRLTMRANKFYRKYPNG